MLVFTCFKNICSPSCRPQATRTAHSRQEACYSHYTIWFRSCHITTTTTMVRANTSTATARKTPSSSYPPRHYDRTDQNRYYIRLYDDYDDGDDDYYDDQTFKCKRRSHTNKLKSNARVLLKASDSRFMGWLPEARKTSVQSDVRKIANSSESSKHPFRDKFMTKASISA